MKAIRALIDRLAVDGCVSVPDVLLVLRMATSMNGGTPIELETLPGDRGPMGVHLRLRPNWFDQDVRMIAAIKGLREFYNRLTNMTLGLKEAKDMVDDAKRGTHPVIPHVSNATPAQLRFGIDDFNKLDTGFEIFAINI